MLVADGVLPPGPDELKGTALFAETPEEAERQAVAYLRMSEPVN
jgi:hypothetical protein